ADAAVTVRVGEVSAAADALVRCAESAFQHGAAAARVGNRVYDIGWAVDGEARRWGFSVMRELCGHGVGRAIHEEPSVPNYHEPRCRSRLTNGLVITIEITSSLVGDNANRPLDYYNLKLEKAVSEYDVPHMFKAYVDYELP